MKMDKNRQTVLAIAITALTVFAFIQYVVPLVKPKSTSAYLTGTITYSDGSTQPFDSRSYTNSLTILTTSGATVSSINTNLNLIPVFTGTIQSYTLTGNLQILINNPDGTLKYQTTMSLQPLHPTLVSGQSVIVASSTLSASVLESLPVYSPWVPGQTYKLTDYSYGVTLTGTFTDGAAFNIMAPSAEITWYFVYR